MVSVPGVVATLPGWAPACSWCWEADNIRLYSILRLMSLIRSESGVQKQFVANAAENVVASAGRLAELFSDNTALKEH